MQRLSGSGAQISGSERVAKERRILELRSGEKIGLVINFGRKCSFPSTFPRKVAENATFPHTRKCTFL